MAVDRKADFKIKLDELTALKIEFNQGDRFDPPGVSKYWQDHFDILQRDTGLNRIIVPECEYLRDEIEWLANSLKPRKPIFVPESLSRIPEDLPDLAKLYPVAFTLQTPENFSKLYRRKPQFDWMDVEASWRIPNTGLAERELREYSEGHGLSGLGIPGFIIAAVESKTEGHYFDEGDPKDPRFWDMYCRLLDAFHKERLGPDRTVTVSFSLGGIADITGGIGPDQRRGDIGARFAGTPESLRNFRRIV